MPAPNTDIEGSWIIQDSSNEGTYPDGNAATIVFNEVNDKYHLTWTTGSGNTYTMHNLVYSEPDNVPTIQGTLLPNEVDNFCATFQLLSASPPELSADIVSGACPPSAAGAYIDPDFTDDDSLAGTWSSNEKGTTPPPEEEA